MLCKNVYDLPLEPAVIHEGKGECLHTTVWKGEEFDTPVRFVNYTVLPPETTFGNHKHENDNEIYIVLSGEGLYVEDGKEFPVKTGSVMVNAPYGTHGLINTGKENLEMLVLEVYNKE